MPHLLIVEDEPTTSWALSEGLADDGYTIDTFRTAEDALVWLKTNRSDLVISDLRLPGLSGLELAAKLRRGRHAQPVLLVTAYVNADVLRDCQRAGVAECFAKPFAVDALRQSVRRALANAESRRTPLRKAA